MIVQLLSIIGTIFLYFFFYYEAGTIISHLLPKDKPNLIRTIIVGFFTYHFVFWLFTLPLKLTLQPLSLLTAIWAGFLVVMTVLFFFLERHSLKDHLQQFTIAWKGKEKLYSGLVCAIVFMQVILFNLNDETYAIWDQSYYLGDTATSLYTNTISQYDGYTGRILDQLAPEYLLETYQNHESVMCQMLHIHPMIENLTIMATVVIVLYFLIIYQIGMLLFHEDRRKTVLFTGFLSLLNYFSFNFFTAAEFLIIRPSEGKTILAVLVIPGILYFFLNTLQDPQKPVFWYYSMLLILSSFGLNMSSIFMVPFETCALYIPLAIKKRSWRLLLRYILLMIPCVIVAGMYLLFKNKITIYTGK